MGAQNKRDDNGDDDNDHGEERMESPAIYKNLELILKMGNNKIILTK